MENQIVIESPDGTFRAYISRPASLPAPAVVVLQELFGVNGCMRKLRFTHSKTEGKLSWLKLFMCSQMKTVTRSVWRSSRE